MIKMMLIEEKWAIGKMGLLLGLVLILVAVMQMTGVVSAENGDGKYENTSKGEIFTNPNGDRMILKEKITPSGIIVTATYHWKGGRSFSGDLETEITRKDEGRLKIEAFQKYRHGCSVVNSELSPVEYYHNVYREKLIIKFWQGSHGGTGA